MGLDDFKTEGTRTKSKKDNRNTSDQYTIHVHSEIDVDDLNIPKFIKHHTVDFIEFDNQAMCICTECTKAATSYEAMLKVDRLDHVDDTWYEVFMEAAINRAPAPHESSILDDFNPDDEVTKEEDEDSGGIMSFKS